MYHSSSQKSVSNSVSHVGTCVYVITNKPKEIRPEQACLELLLGTRKGDLYSERILMAEIRYNETHATTHVQVINAEIRIRLPLYQGNNHSFTKIVFWCCRTVVLHYILDKKAGKNIFTKNGFVFTIGVLNR